MGQAPIENRTSEVATSEVVGGEGLVATRTLVGRAQERSKTSVPMARGNVVQDALAGAEGQATIVDCADKLVFRHVVGMFFEKVVLVHLRFETWRRDTVFESSCSELCEIKGKEFFSKVRVQKYFRGHSWRSSTRVAADSICGARVLMSFQNMRAHGFAVGAM